MAARSAGKTFHAIERANCVRAGRASRAALVRMTMAARSIHSVCMQGVKGVYAMISVNMVFVSPNNAEKGRCFGKRLLFGLFFGADAWLCGGRRLGGRAGTEIIRRHPFSGPAKATAGALLKNRLSLIIWGGELSPSFFIFQASGRCPLRPWGLCSQPPARGAPLDPSAVKLRFVKGNRFNGLRRMECVWQ